MKIIENVKLLMPDGFLFRDGKFLDEYLVPGDPDFVPHNINSMFLLNNEIAKLYGVYIHFVDAVDNYCHFLLDELPRIFCSETIYSLRSKYPLLMRTGLKKEFKELLVKNGFMLQELPPGIYKIENLIYPEYKLSLGRYLKEDLIKLKDIILNTFPPKKWTNKISLFLSREDIPYNLRGSAKEARKCSEYLCIKQFNCVKIIPSYLSFKEQIELFYNAEFVVGVHAASFTNLIFSNNPEVIEILPYDRVYDNFLQISKALNFNHKQTIVNYLENGLLDVKKISLDLKSGLNRQKQYLLVNAYLPGSYLSIKYFKFKGKDLPDKIGCTKVEDIKDADIVFSEINDPLDFEQLKKLAFKFPLWLHFNEIIDNEMIKYPIDILTASNYEVYKKLTQKAYKFTIIKNNIKDETFLILRRFLEDVKMNKKRFIDNKIFFDNYWAPAGIKPVLQSYNLDVLKLVEEDLIEFLNMPIEEISYEFHYNWQYNVPDISNEENEENILNFYNTNKYYLYELSFWEACWDKVIANQRIVDISKFLTNGKILDYGGGTGGLCLHFWRNGIVCDYADVGGNTFDFAKFRFNKYNLKNKTINILNDKLSNEYYDCIVSYDCLEHLKNLPQKLLVIGNSIKKGGHMIVSAYFEAGGLHLKENEKYKDSKEFLKICKQAGFIGEFISEYNLYILKKVV
jgi:2-polyprenyl-3-methyl-5-hydroxy-6-metoxy-1,4-benzoquinol methylase